MKKIDLGMGDTWRTVFKRTMWFSVVIFEIVMIILSNLLSNLGVTLRLVTERQSTVVLVIGIILGTVLNECFHSLWACLAYMFDDIARNRASNERILELLEKQYSPEDDSQVAASSGYSDNSEKKILSVTQRIAVNHNSENTPKEWECPECGRMNPMTASFCKDCGRYK